MDDHSKRETFKIRSSVKPELTRLALKRGGFLGIFGALLIILGGTFLPLELLKIWGLPIFLVGIAFIAIGFSPYRRLSRLELTPHELHYDGENLFFLKQGKPLFKIAETSIREMRYVEKNEHYGLAISLKRPFQEKVKVLQPRFNFESFATASATCFEKCDLFLPYFSKRSCKQLFNLLNL